MVILIYTNCIHIFSHIFSNFVMPLRMPTLQLTPPPPPATKVSGVLMVPVEDKTYVPSRLIRRRHLPQLIYLYPLYCPSAPQANPSTPKQLRYNVTDTPRALIDFYQL